MSGSWYPLAWTDPVPGDPAAVRDAARRYADVAQRITRAAQDLRAVGEGVVGTSQAVDEVRARATETAERVAAAHDRYATTGAALDEYARGLEHAQSLAQDARAAAQRAAQAVDDADRDVRRWARQATETVEAAQAAAYERLADAAREARDDAERALDRARDLLDEATAVRDAAAQRARDLISRMLGADGLADSLWTALGRGASAVGSWFADVGHWFWDNLDGISAGLGVAALLLAWVPVLGQALAAAALILGAIQLARDVYLALTTEAGWGSVAIGALGLVTFGVGRVAGQGLRIAANNARAARGLRTYPVSGQATSAGASASASGAVGTTTRTAARRPIGLDSDARTVTSSDLWSVLKPGNVVADLRSDLLGIGHALKDPGLFAAHGAGSHVARPVHVLRNVVSEGASNLRRTPAGGERVMTFLGDLEAARDLRFLADQGRNLGQAGVELRLWAGGRGVVQVLDVGLVTEAAASEVSTW